MFIADETQELVQSIAAILSERKETIAVSESCCGGLIASYLVSVPGASSFFLGGTTTYALRSRLKLSGWSQNDILDYTGPSEDVALRLARNLKVELGATYTLAETGWAGPNGEHSGTVFLAIAATGKQASIRRNTGIKARTANMETFAKTALEFLLNFIKERASAQQSQTQ